jgi:2',3'-cyclic-nucleotide 2'-phosphodiesterase (5'-nucleotidase family)
LIYRIATKIYKKFFIQGFKKIFINFAGNLPEKARQKKVNMMNKVKAFIIPAVILSFALLSCMGEKRYAVKQIRTTRILMDSVWNASPDSPMQALVDSFKIRMEEVTHQEIGIAAQDLVKGKPQSLLGNLTADAIYDFADNLWGNIDFAVTNIGGIRATLNKGAITVGNIYEIYPFNNYVVLLELPGTAVEALFDSLALKAGEVLSKGIELVIKDKAVESLKIGGKPFDKKKTYRIATINYLAEGNDSMEALTQAVKTTNSNILIRDVMIEHIKKSTAAQRKIDAKLDNRIKIK